MDRNTEMNLKPQLKRKRKKEKKSSEKLSCRVEYLIWQKLTYVEVIWHMHPFSTVISIAEDKVITNGTILENYTIKYYPIFFQSRPVWSDFHLFRDKSFSAFRVQLFSWLDLASCFIFFFHILIMWIFLLNQKTI